MVYTCFRDDEATLLNTITGSITHVDLRWGELANLVAEIYPCREILVKRWSLRNMMFKDMKEPDKARSDQRNRREASCGLRWNSETIVFIK